MDKPIDDDKSTAVGKHHLEDDTLFWRCMEIKSFDKGTMDAISCKQLIAGLERGLLSLESPTEKAASFADRLLVRGYFYPHVAVKGTKVSLNRVQEGVFYKLRQERSSQCLNGQCKWVGKIRSPSEIIERVRICLTSMHGSYINEKGVDYEKMRASKLFCEFRVQATELQAVELSRLTENELIPFFLNVYNCLVIHATIQVGTPRNPLQRMAFFNKISYQIGGNKFSMNDIEHGILRGNKPHPTTKKPMFKKNDPRLAFVLRTVDPRVHFALNCGSKSCPPIRVYKPSNIEKGLSYATENFLSDTTKFTPETRTLELTKLVFWYRADFPDDLLGFLKRHLPADHSLQKVQDLFGIKIVYGYYDWSKNDVEIEADSGGSNSGGDSSSYSRETSTTETWKEISMDSAKSPRTE